MFPNIYLQLFVLQLLFAFEMAERLFEFVVGVGLEINQNPLVGLSLREGELREFFRHPAADEEWWRGKEGEPQEVLLRTAVEYAFSDRQQFDASGEEGSQKSVLTTERFSFVATDERGQRSFGYALRLVLQKQALSKLSRSPAKNDAVIMCPLC